MPIAKINGTSLHFHVKGEGVPIVFIHPPLLTRANFNYQTAQLSGAFKIVTYDLRGHGMSAPSNAPLTYPLLSEDLKQLMDFLQLPKAFVCGYSTGATIALDAMLTYPTRFYGGILLNGMSEASDAYLRGRIALAASLCRMKAKAALAFAICSGNADSTATFGNLYREAMKGETSNWEQYYNYSLSYNCTTRLRQIPAPMLLMYGKKDRSFYRYAHLLQKELPRNKLVVVNGVSHQLPTKAAVAVNNLIKTWIADVLPASRISVKEQEHPAIPEPYMIEAEQEQQVDSEMPS